MKITIYLIRHGTTKAIEKNLYCGKLDIPLTKKGEHDILENKNLGIYPSTNLFFTSELKRTVKTLQLIYGNVNYSVIGELIEQNLGNLDMKSYNDIKDNLLYKSWLNDKTGDVKCPNGESYNNFVKRTRFGFYKVLGIIKSMNSDAVVITHGSVISAIMSSIFYSNEHVIKWQPLPGRGYKITYTDNFYNYKPI